MHSRKNWQIFGHEKNNVALTRIQTRDLSVVNENPTWCNIFSWPKSCNVTMPQCVFFPQNRVISLKQQQMFWDFFEWFSDTVKFQEDDMQENVLHYTWTFTTKPLKSPEVRKKFFATFATATLRCDFWVSVTSFWGALFILWTTTTHTT